MRKSNLRKIFSLKNIVGACSLTMFFSCDTPPENRQAATEKIPNGETYDFRLIYTDSAKVKTILESSLNKDFSNQHFPYTEFPEGLTLRLYDEQGHENIVRGRYAIYYLATQMVELRDSVSLKTYAGYLWLGIHRTPFRIHRLPTGNHYQGNRHGFRQTFYPSQSAQNYRYHPY